MHITVETNLLRHFLAALAYRTQKALRGVPADFATFEAGNQVRTPQKLVRHMTSVLGYARTFFAAAATARSRWPAWPMKSIDSTTCCTT